METSIVMVGTHHRGYHPSHLWAGKRDAAAPFGVGKRVGLRYEGLDQIMGERVGRGVGPAAGADLCVDVRDVTLDGAGAHV